MLYLAHIWDTSVALPSSLDLVRVVCEFIYVFFTYFLGMTLHRDIDFAIDVEPGTKPISIPPYRIALVVLKE